MVVHHRFIIRYSNGDNLITVGSYYSAHVHHGTSGKKSYLWWVHRAADIGWAAGGENHSTARPADDTVGKGEILVTTGSYTKSTVKACITAGYSARKGPWVMSRQWYVSSPVISKPLVKVLAVNRLSVVVCHLYFVYKLNYLFGAHMCYGGVTAPIAVSSVNSAVIQYLYWFLMSWVHGVCWWGHSKIQKNDTSKALQCTRHIVLLRYATVKLSKLKIVNDTVTSITRRWENYRGYYQTCSNV